MEKTLQAQYNLIKEGKGDKAYFLKSAYRLFPDMLSQVNSFTDTVTILKNRGVISENIGGLVTTGKKQDWHAIFNENMSSMDYGSWKKELIDIIKKDANLDDNEIAIDDEEIKRYYKEGKSPNEVYNNIWLKDAGNFRSLGEVKTEEKDEDEELARRGDEEIQGKEDIHALPNKGNLKEVKEDPSKEVLDKQKHAYDNKDEKNYDNLFGQEFLKGYYTEMKDPKNADKDVEELRAIVAKNLAKDINYYVKDGQFGVKGLGYTTEAPGLGEPKEPKGKFKSSGYGDLKESVLRSQIHLLIKEILAEAFKPEEYASYNGQPVRIKAYYKLNNVYDLEDADGKELKNIPADKITSSKPTNELQQDPKAYADEEEFENRIIAKLKSDLRTQTRHNMTTGGEPDMDLVHHYNDAIKFVNQNIAYLASIFLKHNRPEGGVNDAVKYVLSSVDSNPIHEIKNKK